MNIEAIRDYCLSLPETSEDCAFGEEHLLFRVCGKIFACISFQRAEYLTLKCDPEYALELREHYPEIEGAWHWNKKYWNQVLTSGRITDDFLQKLIRHSYNEVVKKLPKRLQAQITQLQ
ncbi:MAG: MmcQ/YjbR family DNA-binding protein [Muribaculaceae bacterium]|nr:MmcQ/YjbR family DNA-binding protein [Muribaculaceae bacterium]